VGHVLLKKGGGAHPGAFAAVFLPMAGVALVGAWVTTRVRGTRS